MALEPLATPAQLAARLGVPAFTGTELAQATELLGDASDEIRSAIGQPINRLTSTVTLYADRPCRVDLPAVPVVSIGSVLLDGVEMDPSRYRLVHRTLRCLPVRKGDEVTVTFTHGWEEIPGELVKWTCVLAAAAMAGAEATGSLGLTAGIGSKSEAIDDYQVTLQGPEASGGDPASGLALPERIAARLRAAYGGSGLISWLEVDG
jgi:hypothetical protein